MALITTIGGTTSNSYADLAFADAYFADHWSDAKSQLWADKSPGQKERALLSAMSFLEGLRVLDYQFASGKLPLALIAQQPDFSVHRAEVGQFLQFPRNVDINYENGYTTFIPQPVLEAQCEQAIYLMALDETPVVAQMQGIQSETSDVGPVRTRTQYTGTGHLFSPMSFQLMQEFVRPTSKRFRRS
jgi:hypothetical protein